MVAVSRRSGRGDWAETWAHYLHMVDLLETASSRPALDKLRFVHDVICTPEQ